MDALDLFIVQEYIAEHRDTIEKQKEGELYYRNKASDSMNHAFMTNMVDEKVQYLLGKEPSLDGDNKPFVNSTQEILGDDFLYNLQQIAIQASNKGIAWQQAYFDNGKLKFMLIPSEQIIPVWKDALHNELKWLIRRYTVDVYKGTHKEQVTKVEIYDTEHVYFYEEYGSALRLDSEKYLNLDGGEYGHFEVDGKQWSMGRVPFVFLKNNSLELRDLDMVKDLVDGYNKNRSRTDELLEAFKEFLVMIKNYEASTENEDTISEMLKRRLIFVGEDGGVEIITPTIDTQANDSHNATLKDDIILFGQSVDRNKMSGGQAPSGEAMKRLYAGLDLKCNKLEVELNKYFNQTLYFIRAYLNLVGVHVADTDKITITFNRDVTMNEGEAIEMCKNSLPIISKRTVVRNHPWVKDVEEEMEQIEKENSLEMEDYHRQQEEVMGDE